MYFPYLYARGVEKQVIKNTIANKCTKTIPIINPYDRDEEDTYNNSNLISICKALLNVGKNFIIIVEDVSNLELLKEKIYEDLPGVNFDAFCIYGFYTSEFESLPDNSVKVAILHDKILNQDEINALSNYDTNILYHIFMPSTLSSRTYSFNFSKNKIVLLEDPFAAQPQNNAYPSYSMFSDLFVYYKSLGIVGFGDFLTLGERFKPAGGANMSFITAALHLTYKDNNMLYIKHYICTPNEEPHINDRIKKVMKKAVNDENIHYESYAFNEIKSKVDSRQATNLATLKRISLEHHIELIENNI